ncbi:zinc ABC transporter substrate-binding protein [Poseidonibacter lekithochrous]|uniref:metal ABC transporter solute-binding protein, Zn/Mn family n=1 Tax=Poseidonibacter TaxID=2321187 RepID=UPI001C08D222|nr:MULTISPECIES: zinc ABC transporter substrate-binding protein [Poseidonibacter]MBU3014408.1 zinc ABC transporter substrate-binding protein [Poseidonibacter lekithochrous]MDO6827706.1 zinc ABC transporter substrate-binding protein [Poseidonibacter sp. 1_MG-2023]
MRFLIPLFLLVNFVYAKTNIVVSILPQQTFVEKIGGDKVNVVSMVTPGSNPHSYEPKASQMIHISKADIYFPIGFGFEDTWLNKFANQNKNMKFIKMTKDVQRIMMKKHNHHHEGHKEHDENKKDHEHNEHHEHEEHTDKAEYKEDPHTWTSPKNVKIMAKNIYAVLVQVDSSNKEYYLNNYNNFVNEINQTDKKIKEIFTKIPKNSKFMVFHPAWGYFAKDYNLIQFPVEVEGKEPKPKILKEIIEEAKKENIKAIFTQSEFSDKSAKVIADELKIKVIKETPLATNWSQNLIHVANTIANNN